MTAIEAGAHLEIIGAGEMARITTTRRAWFRINVPTEGAARAAQARAIRCLRVTITNATQDVYVQPDMFHFLDAG
eukprot:11161242-Lingulodinium_polyedra.AAC.1